MIALPINVMKSVKKSVLRGKYTGMHDINITVFSLYAEYQV